MTRFHEGPATGQALMIKRAPRYLRVALGSDGKWDALDQLDDEARPTETLYAYQLVGAASPVHLRMGRASGWYVQALYRYLPDQPTDALMRSNDAWRQWCRRLQLATRPQEKIESEVAA